MSSPGAEQLSGSQPAVVAVAGPSHCGKTTLICRLLPLLQARGWRLGVIKHSHKFLEVDQPGKDTWRFREAGAAAVALTGPGLVQIALADRTEPPLASVLAALPRDLDLILAEGYKNSPLPKLAFLGPSDAAILPVAPPILAYLAARPQPAPGPVFLRDQVEELAAFLDQWLRERLPALF